jgi:hypothetical protein
MRYYLDAAPIIYLVEQRQPFATAVRSKRGGGTGERSHYQPIR